jgi:hypothetical protein
MAPSSSKDRFYLTRDHDVDEYHSVERLVPKLLLCFYGRCSCIVENSLEQKAEEVFGSRALSPNRAITKAGQNHQLQDLPSQEDGTQKTQQRCPNPSTSLPTPSHALN